MIDEIDMLVQTYIVDIFKYILTLVLYVIINEISMKSLTKFDFPGTIVLVNNSPLLRVDPERSTRSAPRITLRGQA